MLVVLHVRQIYNIVHASTEVHEEASNDWLFVSSWNKVWTIHRFNKLQANKLPKIKNIYIELACRRWCNAVAYPSGANCQAKMISQWVHGWTANLHITLQMTAVTKDHEVCWVKCNVPSPFLVTFSLVPRPLPDFISGHRYMTSQPPRLRDKIWEWPGDKAASVHSPFHSTVHSIFQSSDLKDALILA